MTNIDMPTASTPRRQEEPRRQDLHDECIEDRLCRQIIDAAIEVHRILGGPGLLESIYEEALYQELILRKIPVKRQVRVPVTYKGVTMQNPLIIDLLVGDKVVVEIKATEHDHPIYKAQTLTYLRLTNLKLGLLLNFGLPRLVDGLSRIANGL